MRKLFLAPVLPTPVLPSPLLFALLVLAAALSSCGTQNLRPSSFHGIVTQTIRVHDLPDFGSMDSGSSAPSRERTHLPPMLKNTNIFLRLFAREDKVAYELSALAGLMKMRAIIDRTKRELIVLSPENIAYVTSLGKFDSARNVVDDSLKRVPGIYDSLESNLPKPIGKQLVINGYSTEEYRGKAMGLDLTTWMTDDPRMKFYEITRDALLGRRQTGEGGIEELFAIMAPVAQGKIAVRTILSQNKKILVTSELSDISEEEVGDDMFEIPKGYKIVRQ